MRHARTSSTVLQSSAFFISTIHLCSFQRNRGYHSFCSKRQAFLKPGKWECALFNYDTFTTGVYKAWYGFFSINSASQLASILVVIVLAIFMAEAYVRKKQQFFNTGGHQASERAPLNGIKAVLACSYCGFVFLMAFVIPVLQLAVWTVKAFIIEISSHYFRQLSNTFILGFMGMGFTMFVAVVLAYSNRSMNDAKTSVAAKLSLSGYALPGPVLAVGIISVVGFADNAILSGLNQMGITLSSGILKGSLLLLPLCYMVRFLTAGYKPIFSNMTRLTPSMDEAARLMKVSGVNLLTKVHLPLIQKGIITGSILVFVEIIKEMPVTLMLRPFGWDTLAVKIFELTSEGEWERAALPALTLILAGMVPIIFLTFVGRSKK
ncbi:MAG: iron ABC transporter permease [Desulfobacter sp.]|nr:MAG: iron ABC transporter permease [Desulfobacter sp.]